MVYNGRATKGSLFVNIGLNWVATGGYCTIFVALAFLEGRFSVLL